MIWMLVERGGGSAKRQRGRPPARERKDGMGEKVWASALKREANSSLAKF